jgi:hypothetical protein
MTVRQLQTEYVVCRTLLHSWDQIDDDGDHKWSQRYIERKLFRCERCTMRKYEAWVRLTGDKLNSAYKAPPGYKLLKGEGKRVLMRKEYMARERAQEIVPTKVQRRRRVA